LTHPEDFELLAGSVDAIAAADGGGDPGRGRHQTSRAWRRGLVAPETLEEIHDGLRDAVTRAGGHLTEILVCRTSRELRLPQARGPACSRRRRNRHPAIDFHRSVVVGDTASDHGRRGRHRRPRHPRHRPAGRPSRGAGPPVPVASLAAAPI